MCGIAGALNWQAAPKEDSVKKMLAAIAHRGPDATGVQSFGPIVLGHQRLSIIDLTVSANQPFVDTGGQYAIVFNGEIYNFKSLRQQLEQQGVRFQSHSDTEVILEGYKVWGVGVLEKLVGMFAFALWDAKKEQLLVARDRMGEKPFFYFEQDGVLLFASELQGLLQHEDISRKLDYAALQQYLTFNYVLSSHCLISGVKKLPPAHYGILKRGETLQVRSYWDLSTFFVNTKSVSESQAIDEFLSLFSEVLKGQLISDRPLGAFLSGGLDSSSVVAEMVKEKPAAEVETFCLDFKDTSYSEHEYSHQVAEHLGVDHHVRLMSSDFVSRVPDILEQQDEPMADSSFIPTFLLAEFAKEKVTVSLSGDGGDELFCGYETYAADRHYHTYQMVPKFLRKQLAGLAKWLVPTQFSKVSFDYKLKAFLDAASHDFEKAHLSWRRILSDVQQASLLRGDVLTQSNDSFATALAFYDDVKGSDYLNQAMYVDMKTWMVDDILVKVDRASMANSLEVRAPFLDHRLVEWAASLPINLKMNGKVKKYILKKAAEARLPQSIIYRKKSGFNAPLAGWLIGPLREWAMALTLEGQMGDLFNLAEIERLWHDLTSRRRDTSLALYGLLCLAIWLKKWQPQI